MPGRRVRNHRPNDALYGVNTPDVVQLETSQNALPCRAVGHGPARFALVTGPGAHQAGPVMREATTTRNRRTTMRLVRVALLMAVLLLLAYPACVAVYLFDMRPLRNPAMQIITFFNRHINFGGPRPPRAVELYWATLCDLSPVCTSEAGEIGTIYHVKIQ